MFNYLSINKIGLLLGVLFLSILTSESYSQGFTSPIQWHHSIYEARVSALGQSTAALNNRTSYHANPAIPSESGVLKSSSFLFSARPSDTPDGANLYSPSISFSSGNFTYAGIMNYTSFTLPSNSGFDGGDFSNRLLRFQVGYQINKKFSVGAGIFHSSYKSPIFGNGEFGGNATAWGINLGAYYQKKYESDNYVFRPHSGLSLNGISNGFNYKSTDMNESNLPGQIRLGFGLDITSKISRYHHSLFGGGIYTGFSKYLARWEIDGAPSQVSTSSGFEAIFTTWNSFDRNVGSEIEEISLGEQISTSIGFELHYMETIYLRYGIVGGSDYWIRPQNGLGAEIDLYYLSLAVTHLNFHSSDLYGEGAQENSTFVQATFRLPIDGQLRNTLLGRIFN